MRHKVLLFSSFLLYFITWPFLLSAQLPPLQKNPLAPPQSSSAACSAADASSCAQVASKLLPIILGPSPMEENLRRLTDEIGGRVTGTPEMAKAVEWGVAAFRAANIDVHTEKYVLPATWSEGDSRLELLGPVKFPLRVKSMGWSPGTPSGGIDVAMTDVGYGTEDDFAKAGPVRGAVLLIYTDISSTWADLFKDYMRDPAIIEHALRGGAVAIVWMGARERLLPYRDINSLDGKIDKIPQAILAREDAMRLARTIAAYPGKVRVHLELPNKTGGPIEQENVIGEIRGYEKPGEAVVLGAHLDSWELGTGALDNGCNAALVIEAARALKATGLLPRRTIRFVLFSGEEQGTIGSREYVRAHRAELDKIRAMITFDEGIGRITGYSLGGRRDIEPAVRAILQPLDSWNVNNHTFDASFGSDNFDFLLEGVPTLMANQQEANYLPNYHAASDTFDKVDMRELKLHTVIAALTAWGIADRTEPLGKRLTRAEIEALMKETGLDQQMKTLGYWDAWQSGARGRQP